MLTICWGAKGGSGTTVVVALLGLVARGAATVVDLDGDLATALGVPDGAAGVHDWLTSHADERALRRLLIPVRSELQLVPAGRTRTEAPTERWRALGAALASWPGHVVVDAGSGSPPAPALRDAADRTFVVTRSCFLALRRAAMHHAPTDGVVLVREPGRALRAHDVEHALGAPVVATLTTDPLVARAVDAGLLSTRLPSGLRRELGALT